MMALSGAVPDGVVGGCNLGAWEATFDVNLGEHDGRNLDETSLEVEMATKKAMQTTMWTVVLMLMCLGTGLLMVAYMEDSRNGHMLCRVFSRQYCPFWRDPLVLIALERLEMGLKH